MSEATWKHRSKLRISRVIICPLPFCQSVAQFSKPYGLPNILTLLVNKEETSYVKLFSGIRFFQVICYISNGQYVNNLANASHRIPWQILKKGMNDMNIKVKDFWNSSQLTFSSTPKVFIIPSINLQTFNKWLIWLIMLFSLCIG